MAKLPSEPDQDPSDKKTAKPEAKAPEANLKRRKKEDIAEGKKVSPLYAYSVELDPKDGYVYGPFELEATDATDAKRIAIEKHAPALKPRVTKITAKVTRTAEKPVNFDKLTDAQKEKLARCREKLGQPALS